MEVRTAQHTSCTSPMASTADHGAGLNGRFRASGIPPGTITDIMFYILNIYVYKHEQIKTDVICIAYDMFFSCNALFSWAAWV